MICVCRNGWFHFKLRISCDLVEVVDRSVIQRPLRTRKKRDANKMALELRSHLTPQFQRRRIECLTGAGDEQLSSLAAILHYCYGSFDAALLALRHYDTKSSTSLADTYMQGLR